MPAAAVALHVVLAAAAGAAARHLGPRALLLAAVAPLATLAWLAAEAPGVLDGEVVTQHVPWAGQLGLRLDLRLDGLSLLMAGLVSGVGVLVFAYARWYLHPGPGVGRFAATLTAFAGSMLGLVLADDLLALYLFWELTSVTSYLLIGTRDEDGAARAAALQALLVTGAGGLAMLAGFVLLGQAAGTTSLSAIVADPPEGGAVTAALALVLIGAFTKSAQVPFHGWLPGAMAAPTPVSAYLHSATMVKAGVYLVARLAPAFADGNGFWRPTVLGVGCATMLVGGWRALRQHDLKLLLAHGTVSQLGFLLVLVGAGHPAAATAGLAVLLAHGLFKAALFLVVGVVDHQAGTRDLRRLSGLGRRLPVSGAVAAVAVASMAGLPPLVGFVAKEAALAALVDEVGPAATAAVVAGSVLTVAYGARFLWGAFATKPPRALGREPVGAAVDRPVPAFAAPAAVLAALTVALGLVPAWPEELVGAAAAVLHPGAEHPHLALWHGPTAALALSVAAVAGGVVLFALRPGVERVQAALAPPFGVQRAYAGSLVLLNRLADRVTGVVQSGSLPVYLAVILLTAVALPGTALLTGTALPTADLAPAESPVQVGVAALMAAAAVGVVLATRRFAAVLLLGGVGFAVSVLFVLQGAPDLALTQLLVESLTLVIFVLVLRRLPARFDPVRWRPGKVLRAVVAVAVGAFVACFALVAASARSGEPVSEELAARALPEGGGRNVVNVVLVDIRGYDTLGEITVLATAALGIASLALARPAPAAGAGDGEERGGGAGAVPAAAGEEAGGGR